MALMGRAPHVTQIGLNTQGVFSDVLGRRLPNGWRFGLPNEVYLTNFFRRPTWRRETTQRWIKLWKYWRLALSPPTTSC